MHDEPAPGLLLPNRRPPAVDVPQAPATPSRRGSLGASPCRVAWGTRDAAAQQRKGPAEREQAPPRFEYLRATRAASAVRATPGRLSGDSFSLLSSLVSRPRIWHRPRAAARRPDRPLARRAARRPHRRRGRQGLPVRLLWRPTVTRRLFKPIQASGAVCDGSRGRRGGS